MWKTFQIDNRKKKLKQLSYKLFFSKEILESWYLSFKFSTCFSNVCVCAKMCSPIPQNGLEMNINLCFFLTDQYCKEKILRGIHVSSVFREFTLLHLPNKIHNFPFSSSKFDYHLFQS